MKLFFLLGLFALPLLAQDYVVVRESTLAATTEAITVQQPAASAKTVRFVSGWVDCAFACTVTIARNGTAASGTALTAVPLNSGFTPTVTTWRSSNVGTGTTISTFSIPAGGGVPINLSGVVLSGTGTTKNLTVSISSGTGVVHVMLRWTESQ